MRSRSRLALAILGMLAPVPGASQDSLLLTGFEDPEELTGAGTSLVEFELTGEDRKMGERALRLRYQAVAGGRREYPAFVLQGSALRQKDFSPFMSLAFWVKSLQSADSEISVSVRDRQGRRSFPRPATFVVRPGGWQRMYCQLVLQGLDARNIGSVHFFQQSPPEPSAFLLDHLELLSPQAGRIVERRREVLESLERARQSATGVGLEAMVGSQVERISKRLQAVLDPEETAVRPQDPLVALSRLAREAEDLADSIDLYDGGRGLTLRGASVSDSWLESAKKLSGIRKLNIIATAITDAGLSHLKDLELQLLTLEGKGLTGAGLGVLSGEKLRSLNLEGWPMLDAALVHLRRFPALRHLNLAHSGLTGAGLAPLTGLTELRSLVLDGTAAGDEGLSHLSGLTALESLSLRGTAMTSAGLVHLQRLKKLKSLDLRDNPLTDAGFEALRGVSGLENLWLSGTRLIGVGLSQLQGPEKGPVKLAVLDLTGTRVNDSALAGLGNLPNLNRLELSSTSITDATLIRLGASGRLVYLDLYGTNVTDAGLRRVGEQRALKELYLGGTGATDAALEAFKDLGDLERLDLQGTRITDRGLQALSGLKKLAALRVAGTSIDGSGLEHLRSSGALASLDLRRTEVGDGALDEVSGLRALRSLELEGTGVTDAGLERLRGLEKLEEIGLEGTAVGDPGAVHLAALPALRKLRLDETAMGDAGLSALKGKGSLQSLSLARTRISDAGLADLGDQLRTLILRHTAVSDAGVARLRGRERLEHLDLAGTGVTDGAVESLAALPGLRVLDLSGTRVTEAGVRLLRSLGALEELRLDRTAVGDLGLEDLAAVPRLTRVSLEHTRVTPEGAMLFRRLRPEVRLQLDRPWTEGAGLSLFRARLDRQDSSGLTLPQLRGMESARSLRLGGPDLDDRTLLLLKDLPNLDHLDLGGAALDDQALAHFLGLQRLLTLSLARTAITDRGLERLEDLQALTALDLEGTAVTGEGLRHLAGLRRLQSLNLKNTPFSDAGAAGLSALSSIRKLELTNTRLTDRGAEQLTRLPHLRYLDLYGTPLTDRGLETLGRLTGLTQLYLSSTGVSDEGLKRILKLSELRELGLDGTRITGAACALLEAFPRLERLRLGRTTLGDRDLAQLARLPALRDLELDRTNLTDAGVPHLLRLANLRRLVLDHTAISDAGLSGLRGLQALERLSVRGTRVTEAGAAGFRLHRPQVTLDLEQNVEGPSPAGVAATAVYLLVALAIGLYGFHRYWLSWLLLRDRGARRNPEPPGRFSDLPPVTVQLPMFNERRVLERVIDAACAIDYPRDRLQIQVLDDSTDESARLARAACERHREAGLEIEYLHRDRRRGFKGGALEAGLRSATGEFVAIFDADFVPPRDILQRTIHHFTDPGVGMVQTEWAHLNRGESLLTECQAMFLDGHFIVEQTIRSRYGRWFNFNGTAGVWRRQCIDEAGGWHHDTLTEDTDLSYRAQLGGWRFVYLPGVRSFAELPSTMSAFLGQQHRWTKGLVQNAIKLLPRILKCRASPAVKAEAWFHLTSPLMYLVMFVLTALALPALFLSLPLAELPTLPALGLGMAVLLMGTLAASTFLVVAQRVQGLGLAGAVGRLPAVMALGIGMCASNARAAIEALLGVRGPFVRTPKFNGRTEADPDPAVLRRRRLPGGLVELAAAGVMLACFLLSFTRPFTVIGAPFLFLFGAGYFWVGAARFQETAAAGAASAAGALSSRRAHFAAAAALAALVGMGVFLGAAALGERPGTGGGSLTLGADLALADWKHRGGAIESVVRSGAGIEVGVALGPDRDQGEVFVDLDGPLAPLGASLSRGREIRFEVTYPAGFSGEFQAFASGGERSSQYGSTIFVERHDSERERQVVLFPNRRTPAMGYSDPGFDPAAGIRRFGLKVSAQSERVRRPGYRPFRGLVTITGVRVGDRAPEPEPEVRALEPARVHLTLETPAAEFLTASGVDRPWPFGYGFSGPVSEAHREELERTYRAMARRGLGFTRVYLGDYRTGLAFDENGMVAGIDAQFVEYLDLLAGTAARHGVTVMLSFTDNTLADGKGVEHPEFIADAEASERFVKNALVPIVSRLVGHRAIFDLFNEPENLTGVPLRLAQEYVDRAVRLIRAASPAARLTVVSRSREELLYWRGRGLDLLSHNLFDRRALAAATAGGGKPELDAPLLVAEMDPALATGGALEALRRAGYRGVGLWGWGTEDRYAWGAEDLDRIAGLFSSVTAEGGR